MGGSYRFAKGFNKGGPTPIISDFIEGSDATPIQQGAAELDFLVDDNDDPITASLFTSNNPISDGDGVIITGSDGEPLLDTGMWEGRILTQGNRINETK